MNKPIEIAEMPISILQLSDRFKTSCIQMGFSTLNDIFAAGRGQLFKKEGFTYLWLEELTTFLGKHNLLDKLQPKPGNNSY